MALGKIPRFSPSFSTPELAAVLRSAVRPDSDEDAVQRFESAFSEYIGHAHAVMVPSARFGFYLILKGWGLGPKDEVILPALTYYAVPGMAVTAGVRPVFADIGRTTYSLDPDDFAARITDRTRAVVPTHLFGAPADLDPICAIAKERGLKVIEDCAQATGATYRGKRVGSFGDASYFTFGLTKNITSLKGAMVTTDDADLAAFLRSEVERGTPGDLQKLWREALIGSAMKVATHPLVYPFALHPVIRLGNLFGDDPIHDRFGETPHIDATLPESYYRSRPRAVQAHVGLTQLARIDALNGARARNGQFLDEHLVHVPGLTPPTYPEGAAPIYMSFVVQHPQRDTLAAALRKRGVDTTLGYMSDCASSPLFADYATDCPNAHTAAHHLLHIPVHPNLRARDLHHIAESVRAAALEVDV